MKHFQTGVKVNRLQYHTVYKLGDTSGPEIDLAYLFIIALSGDIIFIFYYFHYFQQRDRGYLSIIPAPRIGDIISIIFIIFLF